MNEGDLAQSRAPQRAEQQPRGFQKGPKASLSLPDTGASPSPGPAWRQLSSNGEWGDAHSQHPSSSSSCHRRPAPGPPRSIHNLRPRPLQPVAPPAKRPKAKGTSRSRPGQRDQGPSGLLPGPLPGNSNAPRERGGGLTPPEATPAPSCETPARAPTSTRPLAPTAAARAPPSTGDSLRATRRARGRRRRRRRRGGTSRRHTQ